MPYVSHLLISIPHLSYSAISTLFNSLNYDILVPLPYMYLFYLHSILGISSQQKFSNNSSTFSNFLIRTKTPHNSIHSPVSNYMYTSKTHYSQF